MSAKIQRTHGRAFFNLRAAALLMLLSTHSLQSQIVIKQRPAAITRGNSPTSVKTAPSTPVLKWNNGESIEGQLVGVAGNELTWSTPGFADPLVLGLAYLRSLEFPQPDKEPGEPFMITMRNGDRLYAKLVSIDEKNITVSSERHGETVLLHSEVASLRKLRGKELLYAGPVPGTPWRAINQRYDGSNKQRPPWSISEGGRPQLSSWNSINFLPLALPERVDVAFHLHSTALPQFRAYLNANYAASPSIETWGDMLVLVHDGHFAVLRKMEPGECDVHLRICWNQKEKRCAVFTMEGEKIAELVTTERPASEKPANFPGDEEDEFVDRRRGMARPQGKPEAGFCIHNTGINLTLESLHVKEWSGELPPKLKLDQPRLELAAGGVALGKVMRADADNVVVQSDDGSQKTVPLAGVETVIFAADPLSAKRTDTELFFADGTFLSGRLLEIKDDTASIQSPCSASPVLSKIAALKQVRLRVPKTSDDPGAEPLLTELDQLAMKKNTLHGSPVGNGGAVLHWLPVGGKRPIPLASGTEAEVIRSTKPDSSIVKASALFFLTNGDILPGELKGMDEVFVDFHSALSTVNRLPAANFHAVQFSGPDFNPDGFRDPGWRIIKGDASSVVRKDNEVTMKNGGQFGHPSVLQADELKFNFKAKDGYGALRLKFFVNDTKPAAKAISMLLMHSGNEIYCGQDNGDGQFQERAQVAVPYGKPVEIKLALNENNIEVFVNDIPIHKLAAPASKRDGLGFIIDPADVWGNGEREVILSNFSAHVNLERGWFPAIDSEARARALTVPRFRRDDLPTHILVAANGDLLRGHIEAIGSENIRVRSGLETVNVPRTRVSAAVWLLPPDKNAPKNPEPKKPDEKSVENDRQPQQFQGRIRIQGGGRVIINGNAQIALGPDGEIEQNDDLPPGAEPKDSPAPVPAAGNSAETSPGFTPTHWLQLRDGGRIALAVDKFEADKLIGHSPLLGTCEIPMSRIHILRFKDPGVTPALLAYKNWRLEHAPEPVLPESGGQSSPTLGKEVKDFRLPLLGGGEFVMGNEKGKVIVLDFWATWCGPCVQSLPGLIDVMKHFDAKRVKFIGVNQGEEAAQVKRFLEQRKWNFAVALDATQSVAQQFGVTGIPHTVIIGPDGKVAWVNTGYRPGAEKDAAAAVKKLLEAPVEK